MICYTGKAVHGPLQFLTELLVCCTTPFFSSPFLWLASNAQANISTYLTVEAVVAKIILTNSDECFISDFENLLKYPVNNEYSECTTFSLIDGLFAEFCFRPFVSLPVCFHVKHISREALLGIT